MTSVDLIDPPETMAKKLPRYTKILATLLGRLAIDQRFQRQKLGARLLYAAMLQIVKSNIARTMLLVETTNEAAAMFYTKFGFLRPGLGRLQFFMPLHEIRNLVEDD